MARILLIDDEKLPLKTRAMILQMRGYEVVTSCSGVQALEFARQQHFDLVITDWLMPVMTGLDVAYQLKQVQATLPVILLAGLGILLSVETMKRQGVDYLLAKPCRTEELVGLVEQILNAANYQADYQLPKAA